MRTWTQIKEYSDLLFEFYEGIAKITINRPEVYNAFRPQTNHQMLDALTYCREHPEIKVVGATVPATRHSARAATRITKAVAAIAMPTALRVSMCSTSIKPYVRSPSPS